jgi:hypothetical protein
MHDATPEVEVDLDAKAPPLPALPRLVMNGMVILPLVDEENEVQRGMWVLPGR